MRDKLESFKFVFKGRLNTVQKDSSRVGTLTKKEKQDEEFMRTEKDSLLVN